MFTTMCTQSSAVLITKRNGFKINDPCAHIIIPRDPKSYLHFQLPESGILTMKCETI